MKKTVLLLLCLVASMATWAVDWSSQDWVGNGAGGDYTNKYKFYTEVANLNVVNIQHPGFATKDGFYITFPDAAFNAVKDGDSALTFDQQGAGIVLHIDNFTTKAETQVDVYNNDELRWTFYIYNADAFTPEATEIGLVGDFDGWKADANSIVFYTTPEENVLKATVAEFNTGDWGFKVRKGTGWANLYGCSTPMNTGVATTLDGDYNTYLGQKNYKTTLHNVTFTVTLREGIPATLRVDADENINVADFHDRYIIVGTQTGWSFETGFIELEYQSEGVYSANVSRFQGDLKVVKNKSWSTAYSTATQLALGDNTLTKGTDANASLASGVILKDGVFTLTVVDENTVTLNLAGTLAEEHSYGLVGGFQGWDAANAPLFQEQPDGTFTYDNAAFPGGNQFKVSIDKSWTCFLNASDGVANFYNGQTIICARANNDNNFTIGESGKTYEAHFVLTPAADGQSADLKVTYFAPEDYITLTNGENTVKVLAYHEYNTNNYTVKITSEATLAGLGGSFWTLSTGGADMRNGLTKVDDHTLVINVESETLPSIYTPLYVMMPGEVNFGLPTLKWIATAHMVPGYIDYVYEGHFGTMCQPFAVKIIEGATVYSIAGVRKSGETITSVVLEPVEGTTKAGVPYICHAKEGCFIGLQTGSEVINPQPATGLVGNLAEEYMNVPQGKYIIYNDQLHKLAGATATIATCRAYIDLDGVAEVAASAKAIVIDVEGAATLINVVDALNASAEVYNLNGVKVTGQNLQKGVYVKNGKKFIVK